MSDKFSVLDEGQIDKNLYIADKVTEPDVLFRNVRETKADIYGLYEPFREGPFLRMNVEMDALNPNIRNLNRRPAGGRIRFMTDSDYIAVRVVKPRRKSFMSHMSYLGCSGIDAYIKEESGYVFAGSIKPKVEFNDGYEGVIPFWNKGWKDITLNLPLYDVVSELYIGIQESAGLEKAPSYTYSTLPVLFYGSSITQGGCASRPGNSYQGFLSRWLDMDFVNLGFSGRAKGELEMAEYIAKQPMSVFVLDYDHNSETEDLKFTHWRMYETVRKAQPELPILMISNCTLYYSDEKRETMALRRKIIENNYRRAVEAGDRHVDYLDGATMFPMLAGSDSTVDGAHPNDLGFYAMAMAILPYLKKYREEFR